MGRNRKPTRLHLIEGTFRPDRANPDEPAPSPELPTPPGWLSERGAEIFRETVSLLDSMGLASRSDTGMLAILATRLDEVEVCNAVIEDGGRFYVSRVMRDDAGSVISRQTKSHPAVRQKNDAMRHVQSLLGQFGLSPATRSKVSAIVGGCRTPNPFAEF